MTKQKLTVQNRTEITVAGLWNERNAADLLRDGERGTVWHLESEFYSPPAPQTLAMMCMKLMNKFILDAIKAAGSLLSSS